MNIIKSIQKKKRIKQMRRKILSRIKDEYIKYKKNDAELFPQEPSSLIYLSWSFLICSLFTILFEVWVITENDNIIIWWHFGISFFLMIIIMIVWMFLERRYRKFRDNKNDTIQTFCGLILDEEAKNYGVSKEELTIYMMKYYDDTFLHRLFALIIPIISTAYAVYKLPGYDETNGISILIILILANYLISSMGNWVIKIISNADAFDFYVIRPYKEKFETIEKNMFK